MTQVNKAGRPVKWLIPVRQIRVPDKYADKLVELAYQWQNEELSDR